MNPQFRSSSITGLIGLLLVAGCLYGIGLPGPLIFDDGPALTGNAHLNIDGRILDEWRTASLSSESGPLLRPISMWSFAATGVAAGGVDPGAIKFINILVHLGCGCLIYFLTLGLLQAGGRHQEQAEQETAALLAAGLWLLAPLHVSTVLYAVQRMAQLATFFGLAALLVFVRFRARWALSGARPDEVIAAALWVLLLTLLSVLSKENGALVLWLIPVIEVTVFRGRWAGEESRILGGLAWVGLLSPLLLFLLVLLLSPDTLLSGYAGREFTVAERLLTQLRLLWQYVAWLVWPDIDSMGFQHDDIALSRGWLEPLTTLLSALGWLALLLAAYLLRRRLPLLLFAVLFFLMGHSLESGIWPLEMVYEHRNYFPSVGFFIFLGFVISRLLQRSSLRGARAALLVFSLCALSATQLFLRVYVWSDGLRLAAVNVANHPESSRSHYFLAESLVRAAGTLPPESPETEATRGALLLRARNEFELMYRHNPRDLAALVMLYKMDQTHFVDLRAYRDWFAVLEEVVLSRPLQASDYNALAALVGCFEESSCQESPGRLGNLVSVLQERYPGNSRLAVLEYRASRVEGMQPEARLALLEGKVQQYPGAAELYRHLLAEYAEEKNVTGLYETIRRWMLQDEARRQLTALRAAFEKPGTSQ